MIHAYDAKLRAMEGKRILSIMNKLLEPINVAINEASKKGVLQLNYRFDKTISKQQVELIQWIINSYQYSTDVDYDNNQHNYILIIRW